MSKNIYLLLFVILLQACETSPVRREEMIAANPQWDEEVVEMVRKGFILKGMTQDQVTAAWGRECITCTGTTRGEFGESWEYPTQVVFFDKQGKVVRWVKK